MNEAVYNPPTPVVDLQIWVSIWRHLIWAAIKYPAAIWLAVVMINGVPEYEDQIYAILQSIPHGAITTAVVSAIAIFIFALVLGTIGIKLPSALVGAFVGGAVGSFYILMLGDYANSLSSFLAQWILATILGSYAGAIGAIRGEWQLADCPFAGTAKRARVSRHQERAFRLRFSLRQMMIASAWLCGLLGIAKVYGLLTLEFIVPMAIWLALQLSILAVGSLFWRPYTRWRMRMWEAWKQT